MCDPNYPKDHPAHPSSLADMVERLLEGRFAGLAPGIALKWEDVVEGRCVPSRAS